MHEAGTADKYAVPSLFRHGRSSRLFYGPSVSALPYFLSFRGVTAVVSLRFPMSFQSALYYAPQDKKRARQIY